MLKDVFNELLGPIEENSVEVGELWLEIESNYTHKKRHYHTLVHLENFYGQLIPIKHLIQDWDTLLFAMYYHDIIYKATRKDNEEKSAELAAKRLREINYPTHKIELCIGHILATKSHKESTISDTNYFTDADLSILGAEPEVYDKYTEQVRKEYSIYPDFIYYPARKKTLQHFLEMKRIFKTGEFYERFECYAKKNIQQEINRI